MKNILMAVLLSVGLSAFGATNQVFVKNEISAIGFASYTDSSVSKDGLGFGVQVFPWQQYIGVELNNVWNNDGTTMFDNIGVHGIARLPINKWHIAPYVIGGVRYQFNKENETFYKRQRGICEQSPRECGNEPVCTVETTKYSKTHYSTEEEWSVGGGLEYRPWKYFGVFTDYQRLLNSDANQVRFGVGFRF